VIAVTIPILAEAWREKNLLLVQRIYNRSSINLLLISLLIFGCIWLSFEDAIHVLALRPSFLQGKYLLLLLGFKMIIDMGTGVSSQIIGTSNFWKFEFYTGIILLLLIAPLNYFLIKQYGLVGAGYANLIAYSIYNSIRMIFLWRKFKMQPFQINTVYSILFAVGAYFITYFLCYYISGLTGLICKSALFTGLFVAAIAFFRLTPDFSPVLATIKKRLKLHGIRGRK
jgi:O-antigen/teichoic acid export membrane protein